jgi:preprotein translocase subunit SecA
MTGTATTEAGEFWEIYKLDVVEIPTNRPISRKDNEDKVYKSKREKYNAVVEEIVELTTNGRPVLVGTTSVEISELLSRMLKLRGIKHQVLNAKLHQREADIVAEAGKSGTVTIATNMAGRGTDIKLGPGVKDAGGLAIIGTERHESRRVDRQLRGRSGRQGDPGSTQFFVSLEDDLMRMFGSGRIASLMDRMGLEEGEVIQHSMITKSIERAQKKVEENNFGVRKRLLEYDDVMNSQRTVIYAKRHNALFGERLEVDIDNMLMDICEELASQYQDEKNYEGFRLEMIRLFSTDIDITEAEFMGEKPSNIATKLYHHLTEFYTRKSVRMAEVALPVIKDVFESRGQTIENIVVPFTDGMRQIQITTNLKKAYESSGKELVKAFERSVSLALIDDAWKEHLREMDELKQSVQNAVYEQKDPLLIYKFESFELFKQMVSTVNKEVTSFLFKGNIPQQASSDDVREARTAPRNDAKLKTSRTDDAIRMPDGSLMPGQEQQKAQPVRVEQKIGRNDQCPCGSGKKYKNCHGANAEA